MNDKVAEKAQFLVDTHCVQIEIRNPLFTIALVRGYSDMYCTKYRCDGVFTCTCAWGQYNSYTPELCSHALAIKLTLEKETS